MDRANRLIEHLLSNPATSESDGVANQLLAEYQRGSPIESLRILLTSEDDRLAGEGTWIASELSESGKPLLRDLRALLNHRSKKVRFWALDCVLLWAGPTNAYELASAIGLVNDAERAVRWKAMGFLSMSSREQLKAALAQFEANAPESPVVNELRWLLDPIGSDSTQITAGLCGADTLHRKFAVVAASRRAKGDPQPLRDAADSDDPEVSQFARDMLKRIALS